MNHQSIKIHYLMRCMEVTLDIWSCGCSWMWEDKTMLMDEEKENAEEYLLLKLYLVTAQQRWILVLLSTEPMGKFQGHSTISWMDEDYGWNPQQKGNGTRYGYIKNHKKTIKNGQARTRVSEEDKKKPKNQSRSQKSQAPVNMVNSNNPLQDKTSQYSILNPQSFKSPKIASHLLLGPRILIGP
ncbi:hypothetical protein Tco_0962457 [Tanacetum coccineum]